jgi:hypothetical protein
LRCIATRKQAQRRSKHHEVTPYGGHAAPRPPRVPRQGKTKSPELTLPPTRHFFGARRLLAPVAPLSCVPCSVPGGRVDRRGIRATSRSSGVCPPRPRGDQRLVGAYSRPPTPM